MIPLFKIVEKWELDATANSALSGCMISKLALRQQSACSLDKTKYVLLFPARPHEWNHSSQLLFFLDESGYSSPYIASTLRSRSGRSSIIPTRQYPSITPPPLWQPWGPARLTRRKTVRGLQRRCEYSWLGTQLLSRLYKIWREVTYGHLTPRDTTPS
jgi:hypothetical protein